MAYKSKKLETNNQISFDVSTKRNLMIESLIDAFQQARIKSNCVGAFNATGIVPDSFERVKNSQYIMDDSDSPLHSNGMKVNRFTLSAKILTDSQTIYEISKWISK